MQLSLSILIVLCLMFIPVSEADLTPNSTTTIITKNIQVATTVTTYITTQTTRIICPKEKSGHKLITCIKLNKVTTTHYQNADKSKIKGKSLTTTTINCTLGSHLYQGNCINNKTGD